MYYSYFMIIPSDLDKILGSHFIVIDSYNIPKLIGQLTTVSFP